VIGAERLAGSEVRVVLSTVADADAAARLARQLLDERLIACANLVPGITSIYRWEGEVQTEGEVLMIFKTQDGTLDRLILRLQEIHPYQVPEVVCLASNFTSAPYARWIFAETGEPGA
jgi:periplasmic divalent cation tolerance protein